MRERPVPPAARQRPVAPMAAGVGAGGALAPRDRGDDVVGQPTSDGMAPASAERRRQVRWLFAGWLLYWVALLLVKGWPVAEALWARYVTRTAAPGTRVTLQIDVDTLALLWIAAGPLVLTLVWLLLVRRRPSR